MNASESRFEVSKSDGSKIAGILFRHPTSTDVVVVCHGMFGSMTVGLTPVLSAALASHWCVARFDFSGCGASTGEWSYAGYDHDATDIALVAAHLETAASLHVVAVVGHSKAGAAALLFAATPSLIQPRDPRICVVSVAGRVTFGQPERRFTTDDLATARANGSFLWKRYGREWRITQAALDERQTLDLAHKARGISCRVLQVHGTEDEITNVAEASVVGSTVPNAHVQLIDGANHFFLSHEAILSHVICQWIAATLA